jgi:hypothetical protein
MMGLIRCRRKHKGKAIKIIVPPSYGGTNDQDVSLLVLIIEIVDLLVDGDNDMKALIAY